MAKEPFNNEAQLQCACVGRRFVGVRFYSQYELRWAYIFKSLHFSMAIPLFLFYTTGFRNDLG